MGGRTVLVYGESFMDYRHSDDHPLQPLRVKLAYELITSLGLARHARVLPPRGATDAELGLVHSGSYVELVKRLGDPAQADDVQAAVYGEAGFGPGDNPVFPAMHQGCAVIVGASLVGAEAVHGGEASHAFNPAGGLHHAMRARASGFCVYNDAAVAVAWLRARGHRVAYVDVDVHHGDGTEAIFADDDHVLTISLHETGRTLFPGTGFPDDVGRGAARGSVANLPLEPHSWDEPWLAGFEAVVPPLLERFRPSVLVTQDGCDSHLLDPLAHLRTSTRMWPVVGRRFHALAHGLCQGRWLALGGGGYAVREVVPRAWALLFAEMVERPELAGALVDVESYPPGPEERARVWACLERDVGRLASALGARLDAPRPPPLSRGPSDRL
ncbi:MAG: acetoin utilization protein AcuC [Candidatus Dormibacterales bacterium]